MVDRSIRLWCIFLGLIAALITETSAIDCGNDYTVKEPGKDDRCMPCGNCHPGYGREPPCGTVLKFPPITNCKPCKKGTFSDADDSKPCKACHRCTTTVFKKCTNTSNTECGNCEQGYYHEKASFDCRKCSHCCGDGKDTVIEECTNQGLPKHISCTIHRARECNPPDERVTGISTLHAASGNEKDTAPTYVWIIVGILVGLLCAAVVSFYFYQKKPWRNRQGQAPVSNLTALHPESTAGGATSEIRVSLPEVVMGSAEFNNQHHDSQDVTDNTAQATLAMNGVGNPVYTPSPVVTPKGTPAHTDDELEEDRIAEEKQSVSDLKDTSGSQAGKQERRQRRPSLSRQLSRKLSYSQMNDEEVEPIAITKHPRSKVEITEGERLELCCEATGPRDMSYQWQKNGEDISNQTGSMLLVTSAVVEDFGRYVCRVGKMKTKFAEVDVKPRQGRRYKLLSNVDGETKENICLKLNNKNISLGGWKRLARKYSLNEDRIKELDRDTKNPSEQVLEYLGSRYPHLTVYKFIKTLTDPKFMRNDVVSMLLSHLTEEER